MTRVTEVDFSLALESSDLFESVVVLDQIGVLFGECEDLTVFHQFQINEPFDVVLHFQQPILLSYALQDAQFFLAAVYEPPVSAHLDPLQVD